jgi:Conjugative transposon protein TcpC
VRRLSVASRDSGAESPVYGTEPSVSADRVGQGAKPPWAGGGGRWTVWPMRVVLWAAILIIGYRGITATLFDETPAQGNGSGDDAGTPASGFPVTLAEAFAMSSGEVYLNYSPSTAAERAQELEAFIPASAQAGNLQFGWNGSGTPVAQSTEVAGIDVTSSDRAVVTLLSTVNGKLMELGVPLYAANGGLVVSAEPALLPAPPVATLPSTQPVSSDRSAGSALASQLPGFFQAFASGDQAALGRYLAPGASVSRLGGAVSFGGITALQVPQGGTTRDMAVTVDWTLSGQVSAGAARLATIYDMSVVDQQSGRWYVKDIRASTQPMGTQ